MARSTGSIRHCLRHGRRSYHIRAGGRRPFCVDGWRILSEKSTAWVVKSDSGVVAFAPQCTHLGCAYHWEDGKREFVCPCHSSLFSIDGKVTSGPAPRPLDRYATQIKGTKLLLGRIEGSPEERG